VTTEASDFRDSSVVTDGHGDDVETGLGSSVLLLESLDCMISDSSMFLVTWFCPKVIA